MTAVRSLQADSLTRVEVNTAGGICVGGGQMAAWRGKFDVAKDNSLLAKSGIFYCEVQGIREARFKNMAIFSTG
jgi:hypothetical protein